MKKTKIYIGLGVIVIALALFLYKANFSQMSLGVTSETKNGLVYQQLEKLKTVDSTIALDQVKGSYFLLHFWAKWCEPCAEEIPHLVEFAKQVPFKVLAVSLDPTLEESKKILPHEGKSLPANFILILDSAHQMAEAMGSYQYPETYLIDPQGKILEKWVGSQKWDQPEVLEFFKQKTQ